MSYLGLDPSTKCTGAAIIGPGGETIATQAATPLSDSSPLLSRISDIESGLGEFYTQNSRAIATCKQVCIEKPFSGALWMLHGVLAVQAARQTGLVPKPVLVQTVKRFVSCNTNASKQEVMAAVKRIWGFEHESHDVVDAYVLAHIARCFEQPDEYSAHQVACCKKAKVY